MSMSREEEFLSRLCTNLNSMLIGQHKVAVAVFLLNEACRNLREQAQAIAPEMLPELDAMGVQHVEDGNTGELAPAALALLGILRDGRLDDFGTRLAACLPDALASALPGDGGNPVAQATGD